MDHPLGFSEAYRLLRFKPGQELSGHACYCTMEHVARLYSGGCPLAEASWRHAQWGRDNGCGVILVALVWYSFWSYLYLALGFKLRAWGPPNLHPTATWGKPTPWLLCSPLLRLGFIVHVSTSSLAADA